MEETMFANPFWNALVTEQVMLAVGAERALRYPATVIPFGALIDESTETMQGLAA